MRTVRFLIAAILLLTFFQSHGQDPFLRKVLKATTRIETSGIDAIQGDSVSALNNRFTNLQDPINPQDAVNKRTAESMIVNAGFSVQTSKTSVKYGLLYNWYAATYSTGGASIAPEGWHVPTKDEYDILLDAYGGTLYAGNYFTGYENIAWNTGAGPNMTGYRTDVFSNLNFGRYFTSSLIADKPVWLQYQSGSSYAFVSNTSSLQHYGAALRLIKDDSNDPGIMTDYDGNIYPTFKIGDQVWMRANLAVTHYNDGTPIPEVTDNSAWAALTTGALCAYNNNWENVYETTAATAVIANGDTLTVETDSTITAILEGKKLKLSVTGGSSGVTEETDPVFAGWDKDYADLTNKPTIPTDTDDQTASEVANTPFGGVAATSVQSAINELDNEKANLSGATFTGGITAPSVGIGTSFAPQEDGTILYYTSNWFIPNSNQTITISANGLSATLANPVSNFQFTSAMVGAKMIVNGVHRIITGYTSASVVTFTSAFPASMFNLVYDYTNWKICGMAFKAENGTATFYKVFNGIFLSENAGNLFAQGITGTGGGFHFYYNYNKFISSGQYLWTNSEFNVKTATVDLGLRRNAAGVLEIYDGVTNGAYRDITLRNVIFDNKVYTNKIDTKTGVDGNISFMGNGISGLAPATTDSMAVRYKEFTEGQALKVDKVTGKGLSTEDYTSTEKTKLSGIATGAEVNVNADWTATSGDAQVLNKPGKVNIGTIIDVTAGGMVKAKTDSTLEAATVGVDYISGNESQLRTIRRLGGSIVTWGLRSDMGWPSTHTLVDNTIIGVVLKPVEKDTTITGAFYTLNTSGVFTGVDTCSIAVYELGTDNVTITKVAEVTPAASIFKATANTKQQKAFTSTYTISANKLYYLCWLYNNSAEGTAPKLYAASNNGGNINKFLTGGVTKIGFNIPGSNNLPSSITLTDAQATYSVTPAIWIY